MMGSLYSSSHPDCQGGWGSGVHLPFLVLWHTLQTDTENLMCTSVTLLRRLLEPLGALAIKSPICFVILHIKP